MKALDHWLQGQRIARAVGWVRDGDRLLDVGCHDLSLISRVEARIRTAVGVDPRVEPRPAGDGKVSTQRGMFPADCSFAPGSFDCITMLAVLEHVEAPEALARACHDALARGGRVVLTVPHPLVDRILDALIFFRLADGMAAEEHSGFDVSRTQPLFEGAGFTLRAQRRFQLGLNRLFVFEKAPE